MQHCKRVFRGQGHRLFIITALFVLCVAQAAGQNYREIDDFGWSRGINYVTPTMVDLDGNGLLDLVVGSETHGLGRWEQTAANAISFRRIERDFLVPSDRDRTAPLFIDLDGDDRRDLLIPNASRISWFEENAAGSARFEEVEENLSGIDIGAAGRLWFGDLDGDGTQDLLIGHSQRSTLHYVQTERHGSTFAKVRDLAYSDLPKTYNAQTLRDLDGDGLLELLTGGDDWKLRLYRQDAAVKDSFILISDTWSGVTDAETAVCSIADIDGDGLLDLLAGTKNGYVRHYRQPSVGAIDGWALQSDNVLGTWDFGFRNSAAIADLDGDGRLDIMRSEVPFEAETQPLPIRVFRQQRAGSYAVEDAGVLEGVTAGIYEKFTCDDIDGDGRLDLFVARLKGGIEYYRQRVGVPLLFDLVTNRFLPDVTFIFPAHMSFADLDANGRLDLLLAMENGVVARYEADAPGSLNFLVVNGSWMRPGGYQPALCFRDLDGDGLLDMLAGNDGGGLRHFEQTDRNTAQFSRLESPIASITVGGRSEPIVADVNMDGRLDIVVVDGAGGLSLFIDEGPNPVGQDEPAATELTLLPVYPQPASRALMVTLRGSGAAPAEVTLIDLLGRACARFRVDVGSGNRTLNIPVSGLVPGVYILRAVCGRSTVQRAVVVGR